MDQTTPNAQNAKYPKEDLLKKKKEKTRINQTNKNKHKKIPQIPSLLKFKSHKFLNAKCKAIKKKKIIIDQTLICKN